MAGVAVVLAAWAGLSGCVAKPYEANLNLNAAASGRTLTIDWAASLPPSANVQLEILHAQAYASFLPSNDPGSFPFDITRTLVAGGESPLEFDLSGWPAGDLQVSLTFRPDRNQPSSVTELTGRRGEQLRGSDRQVDSDGVTFLREVVTVAIE